MRTYAQFMGARRAVDIAVSFIVCWAEPSSIAANRESIADEA
jgi:hypothetical protein